MYIHVLTVCTCTCTCVCTCVVHVYTSDVPIYSFTDNPIADKYMHICMPIPITDLIISHFQHNYIIIVMK